MDGPAGDTAGGRRSERKEVIPLSQRYSDQGRSKRLVAKALGLHRSSLYRVEEETAAPSGKDPVVDVELSRRIGQILDSNETFGYQRVWATLRFRDSVHVNIKRVHRIIQLNGWQGKLWNKPDRKGPRAGQKPSAVDRPDRLRSTDLTRVYRGQDGWCSLIVVLGNGSREVTAYRFGHRGRALEGADAVDQAVISRYGCRGAVPQGLWLRSDNGSIFLARRFLETTRYWGIHQEYIPSGKPDWNGLVERFFQTLKQESVWLTS